MSPDLLCNRSNGKWESSISVVPFSSVYLAHVLGSQLIVNLPRDTRSENTYHFLVQTSTCVGSTYSESFNALKTLKHEMVTTAIRTEEPSEINGVRQTIRRLLELGPHHHPSIVINKIHQVSKPTLTATKFRIERTGLVELRQRVPTGLVDNKFGGTQEIYLLR